MIPEIVADPKCKLGEGPLWHPTEKRLHWTDILGKRIHWFDPASGKNDVHWEGGTVGGFTIQADGALLLFMERGAVKILRKGKLTTVIEEIPEERDSRFNDVIADPVGRVFCGTMATKAHPASLYRLDLDGKITKLLTGIGVSNGLGFAPDRRQLYYTDSPTHEIYRFDYDQNTGSITNKRVFVRTPEGEGVPDGMTVDAEGYVWSARWDGNHLFRYAPGGDEVLRIKFPAKKVSSVIFAQSRVDGASSGQDDYGDMYITTAGGDHRDAEGEGAGALFRLRVPGVRGVPEYPSRVGL